MAGIEYLSTSEIAEKWQVSPRWVQMYCKEKRIEGAIFKGVWLIPSNAKKPTDPRRAKNSK